MDKMLSVLSFELSRTARKRAFWLATFVPVVIIFVVYGISYVSSNYAAKSAQEEAQTITQKAKIGVLDKSGQLSPTLLAKLHLVNEESRDTGIDAVRSGQLDAFIYYPANVSKDGVAVYSQYKGLSFSQPYDSLATQLLRTNALSAASASIHNPQIVGVLQKDPSVSDIAYKNGQVTAGFAAVIWPGVIAVAFFLLVILLSYVSLSVTTEEKENRAAEMLLTVVSARSLVLGKISTIFILGIIQLVAIAGPVVIAYLIFKNRITLPGNIVLTQIPVDPMAIVLAILFAAGGFALFTGILVGFGCLFPSVTDANRFLGISILWAFIPIYTVTYIIGSPDALVVKVFEYFPLTAPTTNLIKTAVGTTSVGSAILPLLIIYASVVVVIFFGIRAFRYSVMEYGRRVGLNEIFRR